jgi:multiple antibiotic resistance protein
VNQISYDFSEVFLVIFIGVGPLKSLLPFVKLTRGMPIAQKRRIAVRTAVVAGVTAAIILIGGDLLLHVFHFSHAALSIAGGIVMFMLGIGMALGRSTDGELAENADPKRLAVTPLAVPLTLNPVGVVALIAYSSSFTWSQEFSIEAMILAVSIVNVVCFLTVARFKDAPFEVISLIESIFGILLCAVAVQLVLQGLEILDVISHV